MDEEKKEKLTNEQIERIVYKEMKIMDGWFQLVGFIDDREIYAEIEFDGSISYYFRPVYPIYI